MNLKKPTIIIIDDDPSARRGLTRLIKTAGFSAVSFPCARDFLNSGESHIPGCILLDVKMPEMTGLELQEELSKNDYCPPIIFISAHGDIPTAARTLKRGAVDFLTKPPDREALLEAIRSALEKDTRQRTLQMEIAEIGKKIETLTPRQFEVMTYVITGILNKQIADELGISEDTVKVHRGRVMKKLKIVSVPDLVRLCRKAGIPPASTRDW